MKEIIKIHLARTPFAIEIDARKVLEQYLEAIKQALHADEDTMREIEARMVEILLERGIHKDGTITAADVEAITERLGEPSEFSDDDETQPVEHYGKKRVMRDNERGLLGGVCAGIADYFGVNVLWPRLIFILITLLSFGTAVVVYAVLWLVIPVAKTAADKLQMRGEPVTLAALKAESSETAPSVVERSKPLVIVLRVLLGLGFVVAAFGAVGLIIAAIFVREPLFGASVHDLPSGGTLSILGGAYVAAIIAGLLFIVLMVLAAYASFTWAVTKKMIVSGGIIVVLGLASFATGLGLGVYGAHQVNQQIAKLQTSETTTVPALQAAKNVVIDNHADLPIDYIATSDAPHMTIQYLKGYHKPAVKIINDNGTAHISLDDDTDCPSNAARFACLSNADSVTIYGPAVANMTVTRGTANYTSDQDTMTLQLKADAAATLNGSIATLKANVGAGASLDAESAAVRSVQLSIAQNTTANFGTIVDLAATVPEACGAGSTSQLTYTDVTNLTVNGQDGATGGFHTMHTMPFMHCVQIEQNQ